jgi:hypothetical protein
MRRFVLVDHSLTGLAGHHYEYAMHVLRAAERAGYEPVLVTNRKSKISSDVRWSVLPLFEFGFWPEYSVSLFLRFALSLYRSFSAMFFKLRFNFRYSRFGIAWACRHNWLKYLRGDSGQTQSFYFRYVAVAAIAVPYVLYLVCAALLISLLAVAGFVGWGTFCVARFSVAGLRAVLAGRRPQVRSSLRTFVAVLGSPLGTLPKLRDAVRARFSRALSRLASPQSRQGLQAKAFGRDAGRMLDKVQPVEGDILFFPTISENDLTGLVQYLNKTRRGLDATWHFLFRRNIYSGAKHQYPAQDAGLHNLRLLFESVESSVLYGRCFFYTDTDELTEQYDRLGQFRFHTVPVPHTYEPSDLIPKGGPLRLTYLGDARTEKGFALLPELAESLEREYLATGKARLVVQCNYNIPGGEPKVAIARAQLEAMPAPYICLHNQPLTSEEYRELLLASDITLLCYDPLNYYARSSGILVESLAVGIPVIVPGGCWLARQFLERYVEEVESLRNRTKVLGSTGLDSKCWRELGQLDVPNERLLRVQHDNETFIVLPVPYGATHVLLRGEFSLGAQSVIAEVREVGWKDEPVREARAYRLEGCGEARRAAVCAPVLPDIAKLWVGLTTIDESEKAWLSALNVEFLQAPAGQPLAIGAVGMIYHSVAEIPQLLKDLIDHYPHFRRTATEFSARWRSYHNADRLVRDLQIAAGLPAPASQQGGATVKAKGVVV